MKEMISLALRYQGDRLLVLDQQLLPHQELWLECHHPNDMVDCIKALKVRGAPLIGVAAALSLAQFAEKGATPTQLQQAAEMLREARPTAVNLMAAIDRVFFGRPSSVSDEQLATYVVTQAEDLFTEDVALCAAIARHGEALIADGDRILTHCNTGGLATAGVGTALGIIRAAHEAGKNIHVYVDETRPLLQGGRLTSWELEKLGIPFTLICDNMAAFLMAQGKVDKVLVGADRIAVNGDFANKVGTYSLAVLAKYHKVPFYTAAPFTTLDAACPTGGDIPIEERSAQEVWGTVSLKGCQAFNPAFDVTPGELVTGLILDCGVREPSHLSMI